MHSIYTNDTSSGEDIFVMDDKTNKVYFYVNTFYRKLYRFDGWEGCDGESEILFMSDMIIGLDDISVKFNEEKGKFELDGREVRDVMDVVFGRYLLRILTKPMLNI